MSINDLHFFPSLKFQKFIKKNNGKVTFAKNSHKYVSKGAQSDGIKISRTKVGQEGDWFPLREKLSISTAGLDGQN